MSIEAMETDESTSTDSIESATLDGAILLPSKCFPELENWFEIPFPAPDFVLGLYFDTNFESVPIFFFFLPGLRNEKIQREVVQIFVSEH